MLLGFKKQFAPFILDGSKTHTIRAPRKDGQVPKTGETIHCYTGLRQKGAQLLGRWPCVRVQQIRIHPVRRPKGSAWYLTIAIDGVTLSPDEANTFAWRDGFRPIRTCDSLIVMGHWWADLGRDEVFTGNLIHWLKP
jgi:hypothetical protein